MFERREIRAFRVRLLCICGSEMKPTGDVSLLAPPDYEHRCVKCQRVEYQPKEYPLIEHEESDVKR